MTAAKTSRTRAIAAAAVLGALALGVYLWRAERRETTDVAARALEDATRTSSGVSNGDPGSPGDPAAPAPSLAPPPAPKPAEPSANKVSGEGVVIPRGAFDKEARDEVWASGVERTVLPLIESDLKQVSPEIRVSMECRTTLCSVRWEAPTRLMGVVGTMALRLYRGAGSGPGRPNEALFVYRGPWSGKDVSTAEDALALIGAHRHSVLTRFGGDPRAVAKAPLDRWP